MSELTTDVTPTEMCPRCGRYPREQTHVCPPVESYQPRHSCERDGVLCRWGVKYTPGSSEEIGCTRNRLPQGCYEAPEAATGGEV